MFTIDLAYECTLIIQFPFPSLSLSLSLSLSVCLSVFVSVSSRIIWKYLKISNLISHEQIRLPRDYVHRNRETI